MQSVKTAAVARLRTDSRQFSISQVELWVWKKEDRGSRRFKQVVIAPVCQGNSCKFALMRGRELTGKENDKNMSRPQRMLTALLKVRTTAERSSKVRSSSNFF